MWSAQIHGFLGRPIVSRSVDKCQHLLPTAPRRRLTVCMSEPTATAPQRPATGGDRGRGRGGSASGPSSGIYRGRGSASGSTSYRGRGGGSGGSSSSYRGRGSTTGGRGGGYAGRDSSGGGGRFGQDTDQRSAQQAAASSVAQDDGAARAGGAAVGPQRDTTDAQEPSVRPAQDNSSPYQATRNGSSGQPAADGTDRPAYAPSRGGYAGRSAVGGGYSGAGGSRGGYEGGGGRSAYGGQQERGEGGGRGMRRDPRLPPPDQGLIMNESIPSETVRLVGADKEMLGVMSLDAALDLADEQELDVIMISPDADPPVCRLVSYDKFKYEEEKAKKVQSKKQREGRVELKELKIRPNTDVHDYQVRLRSAAKFISKIGETVLQGNKVKLTCQFKGREIEFQSIGRELFEKFLKDLGDEAVIENKITMQGRQMSMIIGKAASSTT